MSCNFYKDNRDIQDENIRTISEKVIFNLDGSGSTTKWIVAVLCAFIAVVIIHGNAYAIDLPKEVTPAIRAACERDVRRLCVRSDSTLSSVKTCVVQKFDKLNVRCRFRLMQAGL